MLMFRSESVCSVKTRKRFPAPAENSYGQMWTKGQFQKIKLKLLHLFILHVSSITVQPKKIEEEEQ
jgi:hypothetical protein